MCVRVHVLVLIACKLKFSKDEISIYFIKRAFVTEYCTPTICNKRSCEES